MDAHTAVLMLHGRIAAEWADLLERECRDLSRSGFRVVLDLSEVVFVGRSGLDVLLRLYRAGVGITGCTPLIAAMLEQDGIAPTRESSQIVGGAEFQVDGVETPIGSGAEIPPATLSRPPRNQSKNQFINKS
jgi:hypothetical protein